MSADTGNLTLMPEVAARAALMGRRVHFSVLAPVGSWAGRGTLRVLRATPIALDDEGEAIELVCGYESYDRLDSSP
ncbi:MAG TPA: hypothetical protein VGN11_03660 [Candidatus Baltobacteraceae bacterium]|jgi:hypothetical protein|nr:hypothetical protein [Candidatus Baltobacteraceae bacterium]